MRAIVLAALVFSGAAAWGQDYAANANLLKAMFVARGEVQMALLCKLRDLSWYTRQAIARLEEENHLASATPNLYGGFPNSIRSFVYGGDTAAAATADAEFARYGKLACDRLIASGHLLVLDRLTR